ncbi:MAG: hypothetical protein A4E19_02815 [Nitrospira sp. SG-bin1]|nr:MAG: hypothetical protein A4E19_02815 [Nitrospira sp. SG-bin1]
MTSPIASPASDYRFLLLILPALIILLLAAGLFEFSSNITVDNFHNLTSRLMHRASEASKESFDPTHFLVEVKSRYIWLTTVVVALVAGLYAVIVCGMIIYQSHPRARLMVVTAVGIVFASIGLTFIWALDETHALYRAVFSFSYDNLRQAGPQRISPDLLRYAMIVVSIVNVQAMVVPVVALLAACSTLAPPPTGRRPDPEFYAMQLTRLKEVLAAASAILVSGVLHMGAWLRWPAALIADPAAHESVLGAALAITLFWGVTFTLMLVSTYLPAALILAKRAQALLCGNSSQPVVAKPEEWLKEHGLFLSLQDHFPQFGLMLAPLLASPLSSLLLAPLTPTG